MDLLTSLQTLLFYSSNSANLYSRILVKVDSNCDYTSAQSCYLSLIPLFTILIKSIAIEGCGGLTQVWLCLQPLDLEFLHLLNSRACNSCLQKSPTCTVKYQLLLIFLKSSASQFQVLIIHFLNTFFEGLQLYSCNSINDVAFV